MRLQRLMLVAILVQLGLYTDTMSQTTIDEQTEKIKNELASFHADFWDAFDKCDVTRMIDKEADDIEFYHDLRGPTFGKQEMTKRVERSCQSEFGNKTEVTNVKSFLLENVGKVYGALIMGDLLFHDVDRKTGKAKKTSTASYTFVMRYNGKWIISRILSYNHQPIKG